MHNRLILFVLSIFLISATSPSQLHGSKYSTYEVDELANGLETVWGMDFISDDLIIFTEKGGQISLLDINTQKVTILDGCPTVKAVGQGGMLDVKIAPDFSENGWIYFTYSKPIGKNGATTLARARVTGTKLLPWEELFVTNSVTDTNRHYGSRIAFDGKGHIFFTVGDRGERPNGQNLSTHAGKVLRLNLDGSVPSDNPFVTSPAALPEIYSYGHRNPQGIAFDLISNTLWLIEHGPRGGDEINLIKSGANYGWPIVSHGKEYYAPIAVGEGTEKEGFEPPLKVYIPSIAPASLMLYSGRQFPNWRNSLIAGALKLRHINIISLSPSGRPLSETRIMEEINERIRAVIEGPDENIYFSTDSGKIFRLRPQIN
jgi:glucose/arabinose dehydrogenase